MRPRWLRAVALVAGVLALALVFTACSSDKDAEIADLEQQVSDLQAQLDQTEADLADAQDQNAQLQQDLTDTQAELTSTQDELSSTESKLESTQQELGTTQAELLDTQAQLAQVGELVLADGTYVGQILGAKQSPYRVLIFNAGGLYRVAQVKNEISVSVGGQSYSLSQFGKLLSSTDPDDAKYANGDYKVNVKNGLVTSIYYQKP